MGTTLQMSTLARGQLVAIGVTVALIFCCTVLLRQQSILAEKGRAPLQLGRMCQQQTSSVRMDGKQFIVDGRPFFLKAVHYFGSQNSNPLNMWETIRDRDIGPDLYQIASDGFNTIILLIPWSGFQVSVDGQTYDAHNFRLLRAIMQSASVHKLKVVARVGYAHNFNPENQYFDGRCMAFFEYPSVQSAFYQFLKTVGDTMNCYDSYAFSFFSWEDFHCIEHLIAPGGPDSDRVMLATTLGFDTFLKETLGWTNASAVGVPVNDGRHPWLVKAWRAFKEHHWTRIMEKGRGYMPSLAMEFRVDADPIVASTNTSQPANYIVQDYDFQTSSPLFLPRCVYYAAYWGAANSRQELTPEKAHANFKHLLSRFGNAGARTDIFIEQFNVFDNTPSAVNNDYITVAALPAFLELVQESIAGLTSGYGLWAYKDYRLSSIFNPSFERGMLGWTEYSNGSGRVRLTANDGNTALEILAGSRPSGAYTTFNRGEQCLQQPTVPNQICFVALKHENTLNSSLSVIYSDGDRRIESHFGLTDLAVGRETCIEINHRTPMPHITLEIQVTGKGSSVVIDDVSFFCHVQRMHVYDEYGYAKELRAPFKRLNARLPI